MQQRKDKQVLHFTDVSDLRAHYIGVRKRLSPMAPLRLSLAPPAPVVQEPRTTEQAPIPPDHGIPEHLLEMYRNGPVSKKKLAIKEIIRNCCTKYCVTEEVLMSSTRKFNPVQARQEAMYRMYKDVKMSLLEVARYFKKDHSTVLHGIGAHAKRNNLNDTHH